AVMNVLTANQKALLDTVEADLAAGKVPDTLVAARVADLTALLTLTADQQKQAFTILKTDMQTTLDTLIDDSTFIKKRSQATAISVGICKAKSSGSRGHSGIC
ncbi:MAG TPA: hypothetical protein VF335_03855, partial [Chitinivibrionales bacterium]